jgi:hypothetical protein
MVSKKTVPISLVWYLLLFSILERYGHFTWPTMAAVTQRFDAVPVDLHFPKKAGCALKACQVGAEKSYV